MSIYNSNIYINESEDYSKLSKKFKKKAMQFNYEVIDLYNDQIYKFMNKKEINWYRALNKTGEIIIDQQSKEVIGFAFVKEQLAKALGTPIDEKKAGNVLGPFEVTEKYRGYGFSKILLKDAIEKYKADTLGVFCDNEIAIHLYKEFGFEIIEKLKDQNNDDFYLMKLNKNKYKNYIKTSTR